MAQGIISAKYLYDIAEAIRVKSGSQSTITPAQMAAAIASIDGTLTGTITPSTDTGNGMITMSIIAGIADAIRAKLDVATEYTPSQMADAILSITAAGPTIVSWSSGSDADVAAMIDAAHAGTIDLQQDGGWAVGDSRTISINSFVNGTGVTVPAQSLDIVISSFDDYNNCGCVMQFDFKDCFTQGCRMNVDGGDNVYRTSEMRVVTIPALVAALPSWLKNLLIEFSVLVAEGNRSQTIETVSGNKLALRAEIEVYGSRTRSTAGEGSLIPYYNSSARRTKKYGAGNTALWWFRSPWAQYNNLYLAGNTNGEAGYELRNYANGFSPFGCL